MYKKIFVEENARAYSFWKTARWHLFTAKVLETAICGKNN